MTLFIELSGTTESFDLMISLLIVPMRFVLMVTDWYTGARWYHFRRVFHDWSDAASQKILARTHEAMKKGYSTLLIQDALTPERGCSQVDALIDFNMAMFGGMEKTAGQWERLLSGAGFQIIKIWPAQLGTLSIIEAEAV